MKQTKAIQTWLYSICGAILAMVLLGGITRLTQSGLSITEWKPIMGVFPPFSEQDWLIAFSKYKTIPQFQNLNASMDLASFKVIFFWEYFHRLVGRSLGLIILIPYLIFWKRKWITPKLHRTIWIGIALGGAQGLMGWLMVKSGLSERNFVSHYRLAAHFSLALGILVYFFSAAIELNRRPKIDVPVVFKFFLFFLVCQLILGALTAGLKAGLGYPTFPTMNGEWLPSHFFESSTFILNHTGWVQWIHRWIGIAVFVFGVFSAIKIKKQVSHASTQLPYALIGLLLVQVLLGILLVKFQVPLLAATLHQLGGAIILLVSVALFKNQNFKKNPPESSALTRGRA